MSEGGVRLLTEGMTLSILGVIFILVGLFANSLATSGNQSTSFGGVVLIGPIPIIFGTDRTTVLIGVTGAFAIMVAALIFLFVQTRKSPH